VSWTHPNGRAPALLIAIALLSGCGGAQPSSTPTSSGPTGSPLASPSSTRSPGSDPTGLATSTPDASAAPSASAGQSMPPVITTAWTRHFGTKSEDVARGNAADGTGIAVVGETLGSLDGTVQGASDAFLRWYDLAGTLLWGRQVGTTRQEWAKDVTVDAGGITLLGSTDGSFTGGTGSNAKDVFLRRFDRSGTVLWTRQHVTPTDEEPGGIAVDAGGLTVVATVQPPPSDTGTTFDVQVLVLRYDFAGNLAWSFQFGTNEQDEADAVAIDATGFTVGGATDGDMQGTNAGPYSDAYIRRYDHNRQLLWSRQWGQPGDDAVQSLAADDAGITAVGYTHADPYGNEPSQAFIRRYDRTGNLLWAQLFGTADSEIAWGVAADGPALVVAGYTYGALDGAHAGGLDVFTRRYDRAGTVTWRTQFGTSSAEIGMDVAVDANGFSVVGHTTGALGGASLGETDIFLRRFAY